jgi:sugar phosphate isomerase/epimerase
VFLTSGDLSVRDATKNGRERLGELIGKAERLGARSIYMMTGGHGHLTWEQAADRFSEAIAPCVAQAKEAGIELAIENAPAVYADVNIAHTLRDAIALAEMANIGVCIELFACWAEAGLRELFERALPRCVLMQLSDYVYGDRALPARAVPGDGAIPLRQSIEWLLDVGYKGAFDLEIIGPRIDREGHFAAAQRAANYLDKILVDLGA